MRTLSIAAFIQFASTVTPWTIDRGGICRAIYLACPRDNSSTSGEGQATLRRRSGGFGLDGNVGTVTLDDILAWTLFSFGSGNANQVVIAPIELVIPDRTTLYLNTQIHIGVIAGSWVMCILWLDEFSNAPGAQDESEVVALTETGRVTGSSILGQARPLQRGITDALRTLKRAKPKDKPSH